jgi:tRNA(Arg) A34 adenosine deaminase TadA
MCKTRQNITAIIYDKRGRVLSIGKNSYIKTHPLQAKLAAKLNVEQKIYLHAEVHAITRCSNIERAHRMAIIREKDGRTLNAKPCPICQSAIDATPIKVVEHT